MNRSELISKLLKLDPLLAIRALKNDKLAAKMRTDQMLKELNIKVGPAKH
jgi:hypothetical protein